METLSQLLKASEPIDYEVSPYGKSLCDRASYDRMKRVAVRLAVTLEIYQDKYQSEGPVDGHEYMEADVILTELHAEFNTARAKDIIGEVKT